MKLLVTGASGMVGRALLPALAAAGHSATPLSRSGSGPSWDPGTGTLSPGVFSGMDGVIHLAGENIAGGRWTDARKARIRDSRIKGTRLLAETMAGLPQKPRVLVSASAIGYYGHRGDNLLHESSPPGAGFLSEVCQQWEEACRPASEAGVRVVLLRIGVILSPDGGALRKMLTPFRLGVGGRIGDGRQVMSWISIEDVVATILHALKNDRLSGPVNAVAPYPATNAEFTRSLGRVLKRPTILPMPGIVARIAFGEMAEELLLASQRVVPERLLSSGFTFRHPNLEGALRAQLGSRK